MFCLCYSILAILLPFFPLLFPTGRAEFYTYLPRNSQSVIIQACGNQGVVLVGSDTQRAFTMLDQAWISAWNDKLEVALENAA